MRRASFTSKTASAACTIGAVAGSAALLQPARSRPAPAQRWLPIFLVAVAMLCLGAIAVVLIPPEFVS